MPARIKNFSFFGALLLLLTSCGGDLRTTSFASGAALPIDETQLVTLPGNVPPPVRVGWGEGAIGEGAIDEGAIDANTQLDRMLLVLDATPEQQAALAALVEAQQDPSSPQYHQWLTPAEFGAEFGPGAGEIETVTAWLAGQGFTVEEIEAGRRVIEFRGTAGEVAAAFHTELHRYSVGGAEHIANATDPEIPVTLKGIVGGVVTLDDFRRASEIAQLRPLFTWLKPALIQPRAISAPTRVFP